MNKDGACIDGHLLSSLTLRDLGVATTPVIIVRLGVRPDALHVGGLNLFGRTFGNYPHDLTLRLEYTPGQRAGQLQTELP